MLYGSSRVKNPFLQQFYACVCFIGRAFRISSESLQLITHCQANQARDGTLLLIIIAQARPCVLFYYLLLFRIILLFNLARIILCIQFSFSLLNYYYQHLHKHHSISLPHSISHKRLHAIRLMHFILKAYH